VVALSALFALPVKNIGRKAANAKPLITFYAGLLTTDFPDYTENFSFLFNQ
jgi:hypothetical protein